MADTQPESSTRTKAAMTATSNGSTTDPQLRNRRSFHIHESPSTSPLRRRSSLISFNSLEDASNSFTQDILQPASSRKPHPIDHEITHWSSTPLAFAILPAIAGLLFTNGSAFVTDVLLLALAAVFMNWSIRVPREWYYSAQAVRKQEEVDPPDDDEAVIEESDGTPKATPDAKNEDPLLKTARDDASAQLRRHESLALLATFIFPALAAYLLHVIRSQLSLPSTSLVSDYNISIFLLAAEFWPARQVIRLIAARTLHLQRTASGRDNPFPDSLAQGTANSTLLARIDALEARLQEQTSVSTLQPADLTGLDNKIQKRLEPRLDSLERAVRRYEKRYTTLAMVSDQRWQALEGRVQDALTLAAAAAQNSQRGSTIVRTVFDTTTELIMLPAKITWELATWPYKALDEMYDRTKVLLLGPQASSRYIPRKSKGFGELKIKDDKVVRDKSLRKVVR